MIKKIAFSTVLAGILVFVFALTALASPLEESNSEPKSSDYLKSYSVYLTAIGDNQLKVVFSSVAKNVMTSVGVWEIVIDKKVAGSWSYDRTLSHVYYSNFLRSNAAQHASSVTFSGVPGTQYRVTIMAYAANSYGSDTKPATSNSVTCY